MESSSPAYVCIVPFCYVNYMLASALVMLLHHDLFCLSDFSFERLFLGLRPRITRSAWLAKVKKASLF